MWDEAGDKVYHPQKSLQLFYGLWVRALGYCFYFSRIYLFSGFRKNNTQQLQLTLKKLYL